MNIIVKITDGKRSYLEDVTEDYIDDSDFEKRELKEFELTTSLLNKYNTKEECHFIFGWSECFFQSDNVPSWMYESESCLKIEVKHLK